MKMNRCRTIVYVVKNASGIFLQMQYSTLSSVNWTFFGTPDSVST